MDKETKGSGEGSAVPGQQGEDQEQQEVTSVVRFWDRNVLQMQINEEWQMNQEIPIQNVV